MNESLAIFLRWFWVSLLMFVFYSWLLWIKSRRRETWRRFNSNEAAFWARLGLPVRFAQAVRRFGESKASTVCLWVIVVLFALLMILNAGAYLYFKNWVPGKGRVRSAAVSLKTSRSNVSLERQLLKNPDASA